MKNREKTLTKSMKTIYCVACKKNIKARLTDGKEIYPHRLDLYDLPFWKCDTCGNYVGCHHKTKNRTRPLGNIPSKEIKQARTKIHFLLDPLWKSGKIKRQQAYAYIKHRIGYDYHTGEIKDIDEARKIYRIVALLHNELQKQVGD
jgi:hypothetical protein